MNFKMLMTFCVALWNWDHLQKQNHKLKLTLSHNLQTPKPEVDFDIPPNALIENFISWTIITIPCYIPCGSGIHFELAV